MNSRLTPRRWMPLVVALAGALYGGGTVAGEPAESFAALRPLQGEQMEGLRGRAGDLTIVSSTQEFDSGVYGASFSADAIHSGAVSVGEGAFGGFSGVGLNVLNSGNANSINAGVSLTVNLH